MWRDKGSGTLNLLKTNEDKVRHTTVNTQLSNNSSQTKITIWQHNLLKETRDNLLRVR